MTEDGGFSKWHPLVILIGIIYLYSQLYVQLGRRTDEPDVDAKPAKPETNKNND